MPRLVFLCALPLAAVLLAGCDREEIRTYTVPKPPVIPEKVRLLGAIVPEGDDMWFFKLVGSIDEMEKYEAIFASIVSSTKFTGKADKPAEWKLPDGWSEEGKKNIRMATLFPKDRSIELTVFRFDQKSSLLDNVNRWCKNDLGKPPFADEDELKPHLKEVTVGKAKGHLVDLRGPGAPKGPKAPMMNEDHPPIPMPFRRDRDEKPAPASKALKYATPAGWQDKGSRPESGFSPPVAASFSLTGGPPEVTVTSMRGPFIPLANVNRWRGQVGLGATTDGDLRQQTASFKIDGRDGKYYDLTSHPKSMLVVALERDGVTWYFKLFADSAVVRENRGKFESFLKSVQFTGAAE